MNFSSYCETLQVGINNQLILQPSHVLRLLEDYSGNVVIQGVYPDGTPATYAFNL